MKLLSVPEAAARLTVKPATVRAWIWTRRLTHVKVGRSVRVPEEAIEELVATGTRIGIVPTDKAPYSGEPAFGDFMPSQEPSGRDVFLLWHENGALLGIYAHEQSAKVEQARIAGSRIQKRLVG